MGQERQCVQGRWPAVPPWGRDDMRMRAQTQNSSFDRAEEYLRRVAQLTGAKQITDCVYRLRVGRRHFVVDCKFVRVISHHRKSTCFSLGTDQMSRVSRPAGLHLCFARIKSAFEMNTIQRADVTL